MVSWSARLLLLVIVGALASCDLTETPTTEREVPTYRVTAGALSEAQAVDLLTALSANAGLSDVAEYLGADGAVLFLDEERFQFLPTIASGQDIVSEEDDETYAEFRLDEKGLAEIGAPPDPDTSLSTVQSALREVDLDPATRVGANVVRVTPSIGHSNFEWIQDDGIVRYDLELDTHIDLDLELATESGFAPFIGSGASIKVVLDATGPTLVHYELWGLEPGPSVAIMAQDQALEACRDQFSGGSEAASTAQAPGSDLQLQAELVYYAPPFEVATATVYPYYLCSGTRLLDGGAAESETLFLRPTFVKATPDAPDIVLPNPDVDDERPETSVAPSVAGVRDAGTQWVGESDGLPGSRRNAGRFYDAFNAQGDTDARFNWGDGNAWERDFKDPTFGGNDTNWIDNVDIAFYTGHANGNGFSFVSAVDDGTLRFDEARWGNRDLEWLVIAACGPLQTTTGGRTWWERWGPAFDGLHLLMAYTNVSNDNEREGRIFANAVLGRGESAKRVRHAWVKAATAVQPSSVTYAVMGVGDINGIANWNDYFWGRGTGGGPDIRDPEIRFFWRLSGPS